MANRCRPHPAAVRAGAAVTSMIPGRASSHLGDATTRDVQGSDPASGLRRPGNDHVRSPVFSPMALRLSRGQRRGRAAASPPRSRLGRDLPGGTRNFLSVSPPYPLRTPRRMPPSSRDLDGGPLPVDWRGSVRRVAPVARPRRNRRSVVTES
jgi:hypothetical protein